MTKKEFEKLPDVRIIEEFIETFKPGGGGCNYQIDYPVKGRILRRLNFRTWENLLSIKDIDHLKKIDCPQKLPYGELFVISPCEICGNNHLRRNNRKT